MNICVLEIAGKMVVLSHSKGGHYHLSYPKGTKEHIDDAIAKATRPVWTDHRFREAMERDRRQWTERDMNIVPVDIPGWMAPQPTPETATARAIRAYEELHPLRPTIDEMTQLPNPIPQMDNPTLHIQAVQAMATHGYTRHPDDL